MLRLNTKLQLEEACESFGAPLHEYYLICPELLVDFIVLIKVICFMFASYMLI